jgi:hypothetical protein
MPKRAATASPEPLSAMERLNVGPTHFPSGGGVLIYALLKHEAPNQALVAGSKAKTPRSGKKRAKSGPIIPATAALYHLRHQQAILYASRVGSYGYAEVSSWDELVEAIEASGASFEQLRLIPPLLALAKGGGSQLDSQKEREMRALSALSHGLVVRTGCNWTAEDPAERHVFLEAPAKEEKTIRGLIFGPDDPPTVVASPDPPTMEVEEEDAEEDPHPVGEMGTGRENPAGIGQPAEAGCPPGTQPTTTTPTLGSTLTTVTVRMAGEGKKKIFDPHFF